jgi:hypothetical protein
MFVVVMSAGYFNEKNYSPKKNMYNPSNPSPASQFITAFFRRSYSDSFAGIFSKYKRCYWNNNGKYEIYFKKKAEDRSQEPEDNSK